MNQCAIQGVATIGCLPVLFANLVGSLTELAVVGVFIMLLVGGFKFLFAGGDAKKLESARNTVTQAIIGIVIMSLAYLILLTIQTFTGVDVTHFGVTVPNP